MSTKASLHLCAILIVSIILIGEHGLPSRAQSATLWEQVPTKAAFNRYGLMPNGDIYLSVPGTGMLRSTDAGVSWQTVSTGLGGTIRVSSIGTNKLGEPIIGSGNDQGRMYVLPKGTTTWKQATGVTSTWKIPDLTLDKNGNVIATTAWNSTVWRSTDSGRSYSQIATLPSSGALWDIQTMPSGDIWVGGETDQGWRSTDNGATWQSMNFGTITGYKGNLYGIGYNSNGDVLASRCTSTTGHCVHRYNGTSWIDSSNGLPNWVHIGSFLTLSNGTIFAAADNSRVYQSVNNGQSWQVYTTGIPVGGTNSPATSLQLAPDGRLYVRVAINGGTQALYRTIQSVEGGTSFSPQPSPLASPTPSPAPSPIVIASPSPTINPAIGQLTLTKAVVDEAGRAVETAKTGDTIMYQLIVTNPSTAIVDHIRVTDPVPFGVSFVSADTNGFLEAGSVRWDIPSLKPNEIITLHFQATVD